MIAIYDIINPFEKIKVHSFDNEVYNHAKNDWSEYSPINASFIFSIPLFFIHPALSMIAIPITVYNPCEIHLDNKCIGYYDLEKINPENHSAIYNMRLFDKNLLPKDFNFRFEKFDVSEKSKKCFLSGLRTFFDKKMIIDRIYKE